MPRHWPQLLGAALLAVAVQAHGEVCALARTPGGLVPHLVERKPNTDDVIEIRSDFDGDGTADVLKWLPQSAGSVMPADLASVTLALSSRSEPVTLEAAYVHVARYRARYYVVTTGTSSEGREQVSVVYAIGRSGFLRLCRVVPGSPATRK